MLRSGSLWLTLVLGSAVAAACGSSDNRQKYRTSDGGASGQAFAPPAAGSAGANLGGDPNGGADDDRTAAGAPSASGGAGAQAAGGGSGAESGGAETGGAEAGGGGGGTAAEGCLALHFGNDTDTVQIPDLTIPDFGNAATIELWILPDEGEPGLLVGRGWLFNKVVAFEEDKHFMVNADGSLTGAFAQQAASFISTPAVVPSQWQHVALAYDSISYRSYVNGVKVGEQLGGGLPANSNGNIQVGHVARDTPLPALHGFYSELRVSNVARYTANFTPAAHLAADANTTGLWKMDEGSEEVVADASDLDNPGVITGAEWQLAPCR